MSNLIMPIPPKKKIVRYNNVVIGEIEASSDRAVEMDRSEQLIVASGARLPSDKARRMLGQAIAFSNVARRVYDIGLANHPFDGLAVAPFVVNSAFSIELYLKTLGQLYNSPLHGHRLLDLFGALPPEAQALVNETATMYVAHDGSPMGGAFQDNLATLNTAFVDWRYSYEHESVGLVSPFKIYVLCDVLHQACLARHAQVTTTA